MIRRYYPYHKLKTVLSKKVEVAYLQQFGASVSSGQQASPSSDVNISNSILLSTRLDFGDYQSNIALSRAKLLGMPPVKIASLIAERIQQDCEVSEDDVVSSVSVAGNGYINFTLSDGQLERLVNDSLVDARLGVATVAQQSAVASLTGSDNSINSSDRNVVVDYSSPNIAKEMHVGHLRSTIIGDCLANVHEYLGYNVTRVNHVGDWGLPFGMMLAHLRGMKHPVVPALRELILVADNSRDNDSCGDNGDGGGCAEGIIDCSALPVGARLSISEVSRFYVDAKALFDRCDDFQRAARAMVVSLQEGVVAGDDPSGAGAQLDTEQRLNVELWRYICGLSRENFERAYCLLGVSPRLTVRGESAYHAQLRGLVDELRAAGAAERRDGSLAVVLSASEVAAEAARGRGAKQQSAKGAKSPPESDGSAVEEVVFTIEKSVGGPGAAAGGAGSEGGGGFLYNTTDLAALRHRISACRAGRILYVTDAGQALHFHSLFAILRSRLGSMEGWNLGPGPLLPRCSHVAFGVMLGEDRKRIRSRTAALPSASSGQAEGDGEGGGSVRLMDLLEEAVCKARSELAKRWALRASGADGVPDGNTNPAPALSLEQEREQERAARILGVAAVKYADLSSHRESNIVFSTSKMLNFHGNTAPYLLYTYARANQLVVRAVGQGCCGDDVDGIALRRLLQQEPLLVDTLHTVAAERRDAIQASLFVLPAGVTKQELQLVRTLIHFEDSLRSIVDVDHCPHRLCGFLFTVCQQYNQFYESCPVFVDTSADAAVNGDVGGDRQMSVPRVLLSKLCRDVLKSGLSLLGIDTLDRL